jgi:putative membrane protein
VIDLLPAINALLNTASAILLFTGHRFILRGRTELHRKFMISAFGVSTLFLISYLTYHYYHGTTTFAGVGWIRPFYFSLLGSHTVLAAAVVPLVIVTMRRGLKEKFDRHRAIARWTYPIWLYVSVTGVIVYVMLYQIYLPR